MQRQESPLPGGRDSSKFQAAAPWVKAGKCRAASSELSSQQRSRDSQGPSGAKGVAGSQAQGALSPQESSARWQGALFTNKVCSWLHHPHSQAPLFHFNMLNYMESALAIKQN